MVQCRSYSYCDKSVYENDDTYKYRVTPLVARSSSYWKLIGDRKRSFDGKNARGRSAPAGAAEIHAIAGRRLHGDVEASRGGDRGGANGRRDLGNVLDGGGEDGAVENHNRGGNKLAAASGQYETGRQL
jgi:hypothetical protein